MFSENLSTHVQTFPFTADKGRVRRPSYMVLTLLFQKEHHEDNMRQDTFWHLLKFFSDLARARAKSKKKGVSTLTIHEFLERIPASEEFPEDVHRISEDKVREPEVLPCSVHEVVVVIVESPVGVAWVPESASAAAVAVVQTLLAILVVDAALLLWKGTKR